MDEVRWIAMTWLLTNPTDQPGSIDEQGPNAGQGLVAMQKPADLQGPVACGQGLVAMRKPTLEQGLVAG